MSTIHMQPESTHTTAIQITQSTQAIEADLASLRNAVYPMDRFQ